MNNFTRKEFLNIFKIIGALSLNTQAVNLAKAVPFNAQNKAQKLLIAARNQIGITTLYDPNYSKIKYPMGDVPINIGVCTDVIIRAYRDAFGIDFQELIHKDMTNNFSKYPKIWGLKTTDRNIDHRRVPNIATFLRRNNSSLPISQNANDFIAGNIITQDILGRPHIGIISDKFNLLKTRPLIIHNVGRGTQEEDFLFAYKITGHYRFGL
ncbi:MAG: DUF1287 domain-containing protein [Caulobacterales bacterium]|nr:DUF1287 domain-containing protein [Caulobacterales bacterium]